jgi:hypothetical protein
MPGYVAILEESAPYAFLTAKKARDRADRAGPERRRNGQLTNKKLYSGHNTNNNRLCVCQIALCVCPPREFVEFVEVPSPAPPSNSTFSTNSEGGHTENFELRPRLPLAAKRRVRSVLDKITAPFFALARYSQRIVASSTWPPVPRRRHKRCLIRDSDPVPIAQRVFDVTGQDACP